MNKPLKYNPVLYAADGRTGTSRISVTEKECENAVAVYVSALPLSANGCGMNGSFDSECAVTIGINLVERVQSFMADYRCTEYWCRPFFGADLSKIPDETQALVIRTEEGKFLVMLPVVNDTYKCVFRGEADGSLAAISEIAEGCNIEYLPYNTLARAKYEMLGMKYKLRTEGNNE